MFGTILSGPFPKRGSLEALRHWVGLADFNPEPEPVCIEEVLRWN